MPRDAAARAVPPARGRLDRLATFTFATALVAAACGGTTTDIPSADSGTAQEGGRDGAAGDGAAGDGGPQDDGGVQALYGLPYDAGDPDVNVAPPYGLPPLDAATADINVAPPYGLPPPFDSGAD